MAISKHWRSNSLSISRHLSTHALRPSLSSATTTSTSNDNKKQDDYDHDHDMVMPGFRFRPTEEELVKFYLRREVEGKRFNVDLITFLELYRYDPWELPALAVIGEKEWYFYVPRDRKYWNGGSTEPHNHIGYSRRSVSWRGRRYSFTFRWKPYQSRKSGFFSIRSTATPTLHLASPHGHTATYIYS